MASLLLPGAPVGSFREHAANVPVGECPAATLTKSRGYPDGLGRARNTFVRRHPEDKVLHQLVREHLETFLAEARARNGGDGLPRFVERELREFLSCGVLARGFARFRCEACGLEILLAFSCKGRGFCPACCGRRMAELAVQGVFVEQADGTLRFAPAPAPSDLDVAQLLSTARRRIVRLVRQHGIDLESPSNEVVSNDERLLDCPVYAEIQGAAVLGRVATGPRAGGRVLRIGRDPAAPVVTADGPLQAHLDGFDLHAGVAVPAGQRARLERLCRYILRPPIAQERLSRTSDGKVLLRLRRAWRDGTRAIRFEPSEFLEKLASMVPRPRINLLIYHGVFGPHARCRKDAVRRAHEGAMRRPAAPATDEAGSASVSTPSTAPPGAEPVAGDPAMPRPPPPPAGYVRPKYVTWASLLERTFATDILTCPECSEPIRLIATIEEPAVIKKILGHLGLSTEVPAPLPPKRSGWLPGVESPSDWITE